MALKEDCSLLITIADDEAYAVSGGFLGGLGAGLGDGLSVGGDGLSQLQSLGDLSSLLSNLLGLFSAFGFGSMDLGGLTNGFQLPPNP